MSHNLLYFYQHLPSFIDPDLHLGFFSVSWYSLMYLVAFLVVYNLLYLRLKRGEWNDSQISNDKIQISIRQLADQNSNSKTENQELTKSHLPTLLLFLFVGLIIGARLGYVFFYNLPFYWSSPLAIISPFDPVTHQFIGIYGMSYHGGLIGVIIAALIFCRKYKINFWALGNFIAPAVPAGYFFGRIGNFLNGELYGRVTQKWWGMYFPGSLETQNFASLELRYPSQLYEAILEGIILFLILWPMRNFKIVRENALALYLAGYALARFISEFFREPDEQIGYIWHYFTLGQVFSVLMLAAAMLLLLISKKIWYNEAK